ncbi:hypothetical protein E2562_029012 [Oryza meyeriana var. granulata]|uniref:RING-type E3 ubiquitin transferase n=1 Tax=Oryza meyeriana var. granulata TaxID=110450 RepID=A0A6G1E3I8_9ORYZ|nr:hypothetical protein E2562_029012 [Oryza meyeriana var. granulata]
MADPVTVATRQTYDRVSIRRWVKNRCRTCLVTSEKLHSADVVLNIVVRGIVEHVLLNNGVSLHKLSNRHRCTVDKTATPFGTAAASGVRLAVAFLVRKGIYRGQKNALVSLYGVLQRGASSHGKAVSTGAVVALAVLLCSDRDDLMNDAIALLARLAEQPVGAAAVLSNSALVTRLIDFLGASTSQLAKDHCAALLASLGRHDGVMGHT